MLRPPVMLLVTLLLGACSLTSPPPPTASPTAPPPTRTPAPTLAPTPVATTLPERSPPAPARHTVSASLSLARRELQVQQEVRYTNRSAAPLSELLLLVEANRREGSVLIERVMTGPTPLAFTLAGRRLNIALPEALQPGAALQFSLTFRLRVPATAANDYLGWLGYTPRQLNLGNWLPVVAPVRDGAWLAPAAVALGEHSVQEPADWQVSLQVVDAPEGLVVVGPGEQVQQDAQRWHFSAPAARDFTLSISTDYRLAHATLADGGRVEVYSLPDSSRAQGAAAHALDVARRSMIRFGQLFGPPLQERLAIVEGDFPDGMEFSGVVFVSRDWFTGWNGDPASYLTVITAHEVAHQWWYATLANEQAREPWLDEALATYSELLLLEADFPQLVDWWWDWRVHRYAPTGFVDRAVADFPSRRQYINAVYLQGARLWHALRQDLGDEAFFAWLRHYLAAGAGEIVTAADLWATLDEAQLAATRATRERFLRAPGP